MTLLGVLRLSVFVLAYIGAKHMMELGSPSISFFPDSWVSTTVIMLFFTIPIAWAFQEQATHDYVKKLEREVEHLRDTQDKKK